jgi:formate hydrogenlyase subunit 4
MSYEAQRDKSRRQMSMSTSIIDFFIGLMMIGVGTILVKKNHFSIKQIVKFCSERDPFLIQLFGIIMIIYGAWRIFRGYNKIKDR